MPDAFSTLVLSVVIVALVAIVLRRPKAPAQRAPQVLHREDWSERTAMDGLVRIVIPRSWLVTDGQILTVETPDKTGAVHVSAYADRIFDSTTVKSWIAALFSTPGQVEDVEEARQDGAATIRGVFEEQDEYGVVRKWMVTALFRRDILVLATANDVSAIMDARFKTYETLLASLTIARDSVLEAVSDPGAVTGRPPG